MKKRQREKKTFKQKLIIGSLWAGVIALSAGLAGGIAASWHSGKQTQSVVGVESSSTKTTLSPSTATYSANSEINNYSPLMFATTVQSQKEEIASSLNSLDLNFLQVYNLSSLQITNYILSSTPTIFSTSVSFGAIQIYNPNSMSVSFNYTSNNHVYDISINSKSSIWLSSVNNSISISTNEPTSSSLSTLLSIDNLTTVFKSSSDGSLQNPSLPIQTTYELATDQLNNSSFMLNAIREDISGMLKTINSYDSNTKQLVVTYSGAKVSLEVTTPLSINLNDITYNSESHTVNIPSLTGSLNVTTQGITVAVNIDNSNLTLNVSPLLLQDNDGTLVTFPSVSSNSLSGVVLNDGGNSLSYSSNLKWGYLLSNPNESLNLELAGNKQAPVDVSFSYLFYNYWMISNNNTYGSVSSSQVNLKPSKVNIPSSWLTITKNNSYTNSNNNVSVDANSNFLNFISNVYSSEKQTSLVINSQEYPTIFKEIESSISWLSNLQDNITIDSFNVLGTLANGKLSLTLESVNLSNDQSITTGNLATDYALINGVYYVVYPTGSENITTSIPLDNVNLTINASSISNKQILDLPTSINISEPFSKEYYTLEMFTTAIEQSSNLSILDNYLLQVFGLNSKEWKISNLSFNQTYTEITSFELTNLTSEATNLSIDNVSYTFYGNESQNISKTITLTGFLNAIKLVNNSNISSIDAGEFGNLFVSNFLAKSDSNVANNSQILNAIYNTIFNNTSSSDFTLVGYTSQTIQTTVDGKTSTSDNSINITSITINVSSAFYLGNTLYLPGDNQTIKINITIDGLVDKLSIQSAQIWQEYYKQAETWLESLSLSDIENDFSLLKNIKNYTSELPAPTDLNYSNFSISLSNWNPKTQEITLNSLTWDMSGDALDVPVVGSYPISIDIATIKSPITFKLVPLIYYEWNGTVQSYPSIVGQKTGYEDIKGIDKTYTSLNTTLTKLTDTSNLPNINSVDGSFKFGYYLESLTTTSQFGTGVAVDTGEYDSMFKPSLNISNVFNLAVMSQQYNSSGSATNNYGSLSSNVTPINSMGDIKVYGAVGIDNTLTNTINASSLTDSLYTFIQLLYDNKISESTLMNNLPKSISLVSYDTTADKNGINELVLDNSSSVTYSIDINGTTTYLLPDQETTVSLLNPYVFTNVDSLNKTYSINLTTEYNAKNPYAEAYFNDARYLADDFAYLYPLIWTENNYNCLKYDWWHADYKWNEGSQTFNIDLSNWTVQIKSTLNHIKMNVYTIAQLFWSSKFVNDYFAGYSINYAGTGLKGANANVLDMTSMTVNGITYSGLTYMLYGGSLFWMA